MVRFSDNPGIPAKPKNQGRSLLMSISLSYRNLSRFCMFIISMNIAISVGDVYAVTLETGSPVEIAVQQKGQVSRTPVSLVAPPEISSALLERSASSQITNQPDETGQSLVGPVDLLADGFEGAFPGDWLVADNDEVNGEIFWDATSFRSSAGSNSAWCAGGGADAVTDGSPYAKSATRLRAMIACPRAIPPSFGGTIECVSTSKLK
jgi:hypothetical protein